MIRFINFFTKRRGLNFFLILAILFVLIPLKYYIRQFDNDFANTQDIWGQFGDFLNVFVNIAIGVILGYISFITYDTTFSYNKLHTTPIISFSVEPNNTYQNVFPDTWVLLNLTNAGAQDIHLRFSIDGVFTKWIKCFSLLGQSKLNLHWLRFAGRIEVLYSDTLEIDIFKWLIRIFQEYRRKPQERNGISFKRISKTSG